MQIYFHLANSSSWDLLHHADANADTDGIRNQNYFLQMIT